MKKTLRYVFVILSLLLVLSQTYVYSDKLVKNNNNNLWGDNPPTADVREQTVYKTSLTNDTISDEEYKQKVVEFYAAYKTGVNPKNKISKSGWRVIYEYELEQGYIYIEDVPQWAIDAYNIDLSVGKERGSQFYKYIPLLLLVIPLIYFRAWNRNKEVN